MNGKINTLFQIEEQPAVSKECTIQCAYHMKQTSDLMIS